MMPQRFDVFLCHNSEDKPTVIQIAEQLRQYNLKPWLDLWELRPGTTWQLELERQIRIIPAAAVFVGKAGFGPWQREEIYSLLQQFVQRRCPVIPVLLPNAPRTPDLPIFLANRMWVDFRVAEPNPMSQLVWGVKGQKPPQNFMTPPKLASAPTREPNSDFVNPGTAHPLGQSLTHMWQTLGKKVDQYVSGALPTTDEPAPPTATTRPSVSFNSPRQPLPAATPAQMNGAAGNYTKLQNLLRAGKWREANQETMIRLCAEIGQTQGTSLSVNDIKAIPTQALQTIDRLWLQSSQGKFGFSVQKRIWQECGSPVDSGEKWNTFGDLVGWCVNGKWVSNALLMCDLKNSPTGELPRLATNDVPVLMVRVLFKQFQS